MKRCPSCNQTFDEEWLSFCTQDGTTLIEDAGSTSEPPPTILAPPVAPILEQANLNLLPAESDAPARQSAEASNKPEWRPPPPPSVQPQSNGLATASMIVGIASIACLGPIPAIVAIILGLMALSQIKKNPGQMGGQSYAWTGVITGGIAVLVYGCILIFYVVVAVVATAN